MQLTYILLDSPTSIIYLQPYACYLTNLVESLMLCSA